MLASKSNTASKSASLKVVPAEHAATDFFKTFQCRVTDLSVMFSALARLGDGAGGDDLEIVQVAKQGERMANELYDEIDRASGKTATEPPSAAREVERG